MKRHFSGVFTLLPLVGILGITLSSAAQQHAALDTSGPFQRPASLHGDLTLLGDASLQAGLSRTDWTEVLLTWLMDERNSPTPTRTGLGGGPISSLYIQRQIWISLSVCGDALTIDSLANAPELQDEDLRTGLRLVLGQMGDVRQIPMLKSVAVHNVNPFYRVSALDSLSCMNVQDAASLIEKAKKDPYFVTIGPEETGTPFYPVRQAAEGAQRRLQFLSQLKLSAPEQYSQYTRNQSTFSGIVSGARTFAASHKALLQHLVALTKSPPKSVVAKRSDPHERSGSQGPR